MISTELSIIDRPGDVFTQQSILLRSYFNSHDNKHFLDIETGSQRKLLRWTALKLEYIWSL